MHDADQLHKEALKRLGLLSEQKHLELERQEAREAFIEAVRENSEVSPN